MPNTKFLLQGVVCDNHLALLGGLLSLPEPQMIVLSTAFMTKAGLSILQDAIEPIAESTTVYAGIRNGITSAQALRLSMDLGCSTYTVDTGSRNVIFHPKVYYARNRREARIIVGSANLTVGGLVSNVEASLTSTLELCNDNDASVSSEIETMFQQLVSDYTDHVRLLSDIADISRLYDSGRVVDETADPAPDPTVQSNNLEIDVVNRMPLKTRAAPVRRRRLERPPEDTELIGSSGARIHSKLVWQSNPLTRRDLNIPTGSSTNPTGSMLFSKGAIEGIDQRHYFRDNLFSRLRWKTDATRKHYERANARFKIVVRNVDYGVFDLLISHNTSTDSRTYRQGNSMTQLHWGEIRTLIAKEDLIGRSMYLYQETHHFTLEID